MTNITITVTDGKSNYDYTLENVEVEITEYNVLQVTTLKDGHSYGFPLTSVVVYHVWVVL